MSHLLGLTDRLGIIVGIHRVRDSDDPTRLVGPKQPVGGESGFGATIYSPLLRWLASSRMDKVTLLAA